MLLAVPLCTVNLHISTTELPAFMSKARTMKKGNKIRTAYPKEEKHIAKENAMSGACQVQFSTWSSQETEETMFFKRLHT